MQRQASPVSDGDAQFVMVGDEKKKRRMISNRESARRCRMRKQQQLETLMSQVSQLQIENKQLMERVNETSQHFLEVSSENNVLSAQASELTDRLNSLNSMLQIVEEVNGFTLEIPEIPNSFLEPWLLPCPGQPISASADLFHCSAV